MSAAGLNQILEKSFSFLSAFAIPDDDIFHPQKLFVGTHFRGLGYIVKPDSQSQSHILSPVKVQQAPKRDLHRLRGYTKIA